MNRLFWAGILARAALHLLLSQTVMGNVHLCLPWRFALRHEEGFRTALCALVTKRALIDRKIHRGKAAIAFFDNVSLTRSNALAAASTLIGKRASGRANQGSRTWLWLG